MLGRKEAPEQNMIEDDRLGQPMKHMLALKGGKAKRARSSANNEHIEDEDACSVSDKSQSDSGESCGPAVVVGGTKIKVEPGNGVDKSNKRHVVVPEKEQQWGEFVFKWVETRTHTGRRAGHVSTSWQAICPYHKDLLDPSGTLCQRTRMFKSEEQSATVLRDLKIWCCEGRYCQHRALLPNPHIGVDTSLVAFRSDDNLENELVVGLSEEHWVLPADDAEEDENLFSDDSE